MSDWVYLEYGVTPYRYRRGVMVQVPYTAIVLSRLGYFVWWLLRGSVVGARRLVRVWWLGTCTVLDWLPDRGERSRADGLRVLAACVYIFGFWWAGILVMVHILLAMLP